MTANNDNSKRREERKKFWSERLSALGLPVPRDLRPDAKPPGKPPNGWSSRVPVKPSPQQPKTLSRFESRRERAQKLRDRMSGYSNIYNAAWLVRDSQHGSAQRRQEYIDRFAEILRIELSKCSDAEALLYAVADSLTLGELPWEGGR